MSRMLYQHHDRAFIFSQNDRPDAWCVSAEIENRDNARWPIPCVSFSFGNFSVFAYDTDDMEKVDDLIHALERARAALVLFRDEAKELCKP